MKRLLVTLSLAAAALVGCTSEESSDKPVKTVDVKFNVALPTDPAPAVKAGDKLRVYQICGGDYSFADVVLYGDALSGSGLSFTASLPENASGEVSWSAIFPAPYSPSSQMMYLPYIQTSDGNIPGEADILAGNGGLSSDGSVSIALSRYGGIFNLNVEDLPEGTVPSKVELTFPSDVAGTFTFDPVTMTIRPASVGTFKTISVTPSAASLSVRTFDMTLAGGDRVFVKTTAPGKTGSTSTMVTDTVSLSSGASLSVSLKAFWDVTFNNPVLSKDWSDPTVWYDGENFYSTATNFGKYIHTSTDLTSWTATECRAQTEAGTVEAQKFGAGFWAPDVVKIGSYWNMYASFVDSGVKTAVGLFRSTSATGPFEYFGIVTSSEDNGLKNVIDPEVVVDPETGKVWLFFGSGRVYRVELTSDGTALAEGAKIEHVGGILISDDSSTRQKVFEGTYLYKRGDYWYMFVSCGQYSKANYTTLVGRSASIDGVFVDKKGNNLTTGSASVVIATGKDATFYGPGHNGEIFTDITGQDYILYHCHNDSVTGVAAERFLMLQRLYWDADGWPYVEGGSPLSSDLAPQFR